jgi:trimethylamine:corrinoid methyltransferase-like protein
LPWTEVANPYPPLATAPPSFVLEPRNAARRIVMGANRINFGLVAGPPNVHDCERGRRPGNYRDYCDFIRLAQYFNAIHLLGNQVCAPIGMPANSRHLDTYRANLIYSDKVFHCSAIGAGRALDAVRMAAIARGIPFEQIARRTSPADSSRGAIACRTAPPMPAPRMPPMPRAPTRRKCLYGERSWDTSTSSTTRRDATQRATDIWKTALKEYVEPAMDPAIREALDAYVERRRTEIGSEEP